MKEVMTMTKKDYFNLKLKLLVFLRKEGSSRLLDDLLFCVLSIPVEKKKTALWLYKEITRYLELIQEAEPFPTTRKLSKMLCIFERLSNYRASRIQDGSYQQLIKTYPTSIFFENALGSNAPLELTDLEEGKEDFILWPICERCHNMLNERLKPIGPDGSLDVCYSLKTEDIEFAYKLT